MDLRRRSIDTSFGGGSRVGLPAQVQRSSPEALLATRPQPLALDRHRPLEGDDGKTVEAVITCLVDAVLLDDNDDWALQHRNMQVEGMTELDAPSSEETSTLLITLTAA